MAVSVSASKAPMTSIATAAHGSEGAPASSSSAPVETIWKTAAVVREPSQAMSPAAAHPRAMPPIGQSPRTRPQSAVLAWRRSMIQG